MLGKAQTATSDRFYEPCLVFGLSVGLFIASVALFAIFYCYEPTINERAPHLKRQLLRWLKSVKSALMRNTTPGTANSGAQPLLQHHAKLA